METMRDALDRLTAAGFVDDLVVDDGHLTAARSGRRFDPAELEIVETVRFEGVSDPDDEAVLLALSTAAGEPVGTFAVPYGPAAGPAEAAVLRELERPTGGATTTDG
jgi:hypothetical protein